MENWGIVKRDWKLAPIQAARSPSPAVFGRPEDIGMSLRTIKRAHSPLRMARSHGAKCSAKNLLRSGSIRLS